MKKYKLLKEYPGSPELGTIVKELYYVYKGLKHSPMYDEYWEEVVEKDYEILRYYSIENPSIGRTTCNSKLNDTYNIYSVKRLSDGEVFTIGDKAKTVDINGRHTITQFRIKQKCFGKNFSGNYTYDGIDRIWIDWEENCGGNWLESTEKIVEKDYQILKSCPIEGTIYSVERLSDGEVFTVGDKVKVYQHGSTKTITEIIINVNSLVIEGIWLRLDSGSCHMTHAIKVENPIYLTHDGKDIFEGDKVWYINKDGLRYGVFYTLPGTKFYSDINVYFITRAAAENYLVQKSHSLSIEDFWEFVCWGGSNIAKSKRLKRLVRERLNLK